MVWTEKQRTDGKNKILLHTTIQRVLLGIYYMSILYENVASC
jgi:hypothetical protein